jgi:hypothetical protein
VLNLYVIITITIDHRTLFSHGYNFGALSLKKGLWRRPNLTMHVYRSNVVRFSGGDIYVLISFNTFYIGGK